METDTKAMERIVKARSELILDHTFYGVLISNVEPKISRRVPTAATDGKTHYWNPDFIATLSQDELLTVQRHESEHDARRHHSRRGSRDPEEWNKATDYAINIDLVDESCVMPKGALVDPKYRGWSAEDIYRARELDREQERKRQQQQQAGDDDDEAEAGNGGGDEQDDQDDQDDQDGADQDQAGDGQDQNDRSELGDDDADEAGDQGGDGQGGDGGEDDADGDDGSESSQGGGAGDDEDGDDPSAANTGEQQGAGKPADAAGGGAGSGSQGDAGNEATSDAKGGGNGSDAEVDETGDADGNANGKPIPGSADPGGMGAVLDAADDAADLSDADSKWERILRQAASLAAKRGDAPGHVSREIERADKPPQDWRETLRAWFDHGATSVETWNRPNRRFIGGGLYLPGRQKDGINRVVFLIDTSGSMDKIALECIAVETQAALDENIIDEVVIVYGDTRVTRVDTYRNGDEIEFDPRGGGGTVLRPLFNYVRDEVEDPSLIVAFTDGFIDDVAAGGEPPTDVLWAYTGYPDHVRSHMANTPWGAPAIDVGSH